MRPILLALSLLAATSAAACAASAPGALPRAVAAAPFEDGVAVEVIRDGDRWTVDYDLDRDAPVWVFRRSALIAEARRAWRQDQWRVLTPGVVMERRGGYDLIRSADAGPVPRRVRFAMSPAPADLEADYDPALLFSDGSVALFSDQFDVIPLGSVREAAALPLDLNTVRIDGGPSRVTWRDRAGPVLLEGERVSDAVTRDAQTYVLFGRPRVIEGERLNTVVDPALPPWIAAEIGDLAPRVADFYARRLGPGPRAKPTVMRNWTGPTAGMTSMGGGVVPGLITMTFEGSGVVTRSDEVLAVSRWFVAHESAHFWLGQAVRYEYARDAWITEGGADLMAVRALAALNPVYDPRVELQKSVDDCIDLARGRAVATAAERGEHRAYYACGAVWALAAEGAVRQRGGENWFDFLRPLLDANRGDGVLTREEWLTALTRASRDPSLRVDIGRMLDQGVADPGAVLERLFDRTGVAYRREAGRVVLR